MIKITPGIFFKKKHLSLKGNLCQESTPCSLILWHSCLRKITVDWNFIKHNVYIMIAVLQEGCIPISYHTGKCILFLYWTFCYILVYPKKVQSFQNLISYWIILFRIWLFTVFLFFFIDNMWKKYRTLTSETSNISKHIQKFKFFFLHMFWKKSLYIKGNVWITSMKCR